MANNYTSIADLADTIRRNLWRVPSDVSLIVGVPRSGLMAALMVGEFLHKPVIDLDGYLRSSAPFVGSRGKHMNTSGNRVLLLDDTVFSGRSIERVKKLIGTRENVLYGCIYAEGEHATDFVDLYFENNYDPAVKPWHLYEWNILHHGAKLSEACMFDLDGVLCAEPPDERDTEHYENYIANATPLIVPTTKIGAIVTYRCERYRKVTADWLKRHGVQYNELFMCQCEHHRSSANAARYKAFGYEQAKWALLFVESDPAQAELIAKTTGKPVFCYSNGKMY